MLCQFLQIIVNSMYAYSDMLYGVCKFHETYCFLEYAMLQQKTDNGVGAARKAKTLWCTNCCYCDGCKRYSERLCNRQCFKI